MLAPAEVESMGAELQPLFLPEAGTEPWDAQAGTVERLSVCAVLQSGAGGTEQVARLLAFAKTRLREASDGEDADAQAAARAAALHPRRSRL